LLKTWYLLTNALILYQQKTNIMNYHILQLIIAASIAAVIALGAFITFKTAKN